MADLRGGDTDDLAKPTQETGDPSPSSLSHATYCQESAGQVTPIGSEIKNALLENMREPNPLCLGHEEKLDKLYDSYQKHKNCTPGGKKNVVHVINGLPGCGKTEMAIQYVERYKDIYRVVIWIPSESTSTIDYGFKHFCEKLNLPMDSPLRAESIHFAAIEWLKGNGNWLLVFNNADSVDVIDDYILRSLPAGGHIIITSRDKEFNTLGSTLPPFYVKPFSPDNAALLLVRGLYRDEGSHINIENAKQKVRELETSDAENYHALQWLAGPEGLEGLPLALNAAIEYMLLHDRSFSQYEGIYKECFEQIFREDDPLKSFLKKINLDTYYPQLRKSVQTSLTKFLDITEDDLKGSEIGMTTDDSVKFLQARKHNVNVNKWMAERRNVVTTWALTFNSINEQPLGPAMMEFLQLCAFIAPTEDLLIRGVSHLQLPNLHAALLCNLQGDSKRQPEQIKVNIDKVLECLRRYSLLDNYNTMPDGTPPVRKFTIHHVLQEVMKLRLMKENKTTQIVSSIVTLLASLIPTYDDKYRSYSWHNIKPTGIQEEVALHVMSLTQVLSKVSPPDIRLEKAIPLLFSIGIYLRHIKWRPKEAILLYKTALKLAEVLFPDSDEMVAGSKVLGDAHFNLASVLLEVGEEEKVSDHLMKAKELYLKSCPVEDRERSLDIAKVHYLEATVHEDVFCERTYDRLDQSNLKSVFESLSMSIQMSTKYYKGEGKRFGSWTAIAKHTLGTYHLQYESKTDEEVEEILNSSLAMKKECWGNDHISIAIGMADLGRLYLVMNDKSKLGSAKEYLEQSLEMKERVLPDYEQFYTWKLGIYLLVRLYRKMKDEDLEKKYLGILTKKAGGRFDRYFNEEDRLKAFPLEPLQWV
ncbi:uncharacterized protein LOC144438868 [Glandiceps talaboti]